MEFTPLKLPRPAHTKMNATKSKNSHGHTSRDIVDVHTSPLRRTNAWRQLLAQQKRVCAQHYSQ